MSLVQVIWTQRAKGEFHHIMLSNHFAELPSYELISVERPPQNELEAD